MTIVMPLWPALLLPPMAHLAHRVQRYGAHLLQAGDRHDVHSPFVFRLVHEVLRPQAPPPCAAIIEPLRRELLRRKDTIDVTDLGAGSHHLHGRTRRVDHIARTALKPPSRAWLLHRFAQHVHARTIVELGTSLGISTLYLAHASPEARVITFEGCPATLAIAEDLFQRAGVHNVRTSSGAFADTVPAVLRDMQRVDLAFLDGHHEQQATEALFLQLLPLAHADSVFVLDDIHWSPGMSAAWDTVKAHPSVTVSIDLFDMGLLFFHKGQAREAFRLKY